MTITITRRQDDGNLRPVPDGNPRNRWSYDIRVELGELSASGRTTVRAVAAPSMTDNEMILPPEMDRGRAR